MTRGGVAGLRGLVAGLALAIASMVATPAVLADPGEIRAGHPGTILRGITEYQFRSQGCRSLPAEPWQGADGWVIDLGTNTYLRLTGSSGAPFALNVVFYKAGPPCDEIGTRYVGNLTRTDWKGAVPEGARWVVVSASYGANVALTYIACTPGLNCPPGISS